MGDNTRTAVILRTDAGFGNEIRNGIEVLKGAGFDDVRVWSMPDVKEAADGYEVRFAAGDTEPKARNEMLSEFAKAGYKGFLYVIRCNTDLTPRFREFTGDLEKAMRLFDYGVWLATVTDGCNYVYSKYNPRITIAMDRPDVAEKTGLSCDLSFTSHSNTQVMAYDFSAFGDEGPMRFDEDFTVPMYWIIEFLARRRNTSPGSMYFMNEYLTVGSEQGAFSTSPRAAGSKDDAAAMKVDGEKFTAKRINHEADGNMDTVLTRIWEKIKAKTGLVF